MKTILITGSNGFLGQKLIEILIKTPEYHLIATSKGLNRHATPAEFLYESMDILNHANVAEVFLRHQPDIVIHTAAITNADVCETHPKLARELNVTATKHIAQLCKKRNAFLVHLSTDFVFDGEVGPYSENDEPSPISEYGRTKLESELMVRESAGKWAIIRTILVYGLPADESRSNIVLWAKSALEQGTPIKVVNNQWRMPTLVDDLAACCLLVAERKAQGIFHISGSEFMRISDIVYSVADFWKLDFSAVTEVSAESLQQLAKRPLKTGFILDKAIDELGYRPRTFKEGLKLVDGQIKERLK